MNLEITMNIAFLKGDRTFSFFDEDALVLK
jgi:hypothetical protein